ncbi:DUF3696 domain-containing protein [Elizabethkingia sp. HX XZB]|uniref:AAA family ATPase n=1 Tax=Elizabethkingia sp. HX XZB TaxID=3003193 RepID=UPI002A24EBF7|nr:DUF3696 domain-containing protein [Elizabethkingia sp. HX XZB]MDX8568139.1 DUF3696 domain-containing protein [Elizabethkingia sp. HX XZB]
MLDEISFKNYKIFKEKQTFKIKPLTIIIGKNNTGKSAILKLMPLIESALNKSTDKVFELNNEGVISAKKYKDLIYGKFSRSLEIELSEIKPDKKTTLKSGIIVDNNKDLPIIESWQLKETNNNKDEIIVDLLKDNNNNNNNTYINDLDSIEYACSFSGLYLNSYMNQESKITTKITNEQLTLKTDFIGAIREIAKQDYRLQIEQDKSGVDGRFLYDYLIRDYQTTDKKYFNQISSWISENFEGWYIYIDIDNEPYHIELKNENLSINLSETGLGIGQVLPLIIRAYRPCYEDTLILIEEPEAHLHPFAHTQIAQLLAESTKNDPYKKYIIETHSQNFILRLRRLIAEGIISSNDIAIYYVNYDEIKKESTLNEISVDERGGVNWWPDGIFGETNIETRAIYNAQLNDSKNVGRN